MIWTVTVLWLFTTFTLSTTAYARETNAQRLAKGLPPLAPKRFGSVPGYFQPPTRVTVEKSRTSPSSVPSQRFARRDQVRITTPHAYTGRVQVRDEDGSVLGFLRTNVMDGTVAGINFHGDDDLHVKFTTISSPFNIIATNPLFRAPFCIGLTAVSSMAPNSSTTAALANVPKTSRPTSKAQSAIWSFDEQTRELTAQYTNPADGTKFPIMLAYEERENFLFFVGDIAAHNLVAEFVAVRVKLYFADF